MTALWIILGVIAALILIIVVLLHFSVKAYIEVDKKHAGVVVKYLGFKVYKTELPDKNKQKDEPEKQVEISDDKPSFELSEIEPVDSTDESEKAEIEKKIEEAAESMPDKSDNESEAAGEETLDEDKDKPVEEEKEPKPSLLEQFNEYKKYIPAGKKAFRKLLKLIRFRDFAFELTVGNDDPYKAGLSFGRISAVVYNIIGLLCCIFSVKIDHTDIKCDFEKKQTDIYFKTAIFVRPSAVIALAVYIGVYYLKIRKSMKKLDKIAKEKAT